MIETDKFCLRNCWKLFVIHVCAEEESQRKRNNIKLFKMQDQTKDPESFN
jgi:hypothetical protein